MAQEPLSEERREAGGDYLAALQRLGLKPEGLLWAFHQERKELQLAMVTSLVDRIGSLDIYKVLMQAYDAAGTPKSVDPFIVSLYSPNSIFATGLKGAYDIEIAGNPHGKLSTGETVDLGEIWFQAGSFTFRKSWVYVALRRAPESRHQIKEWDRFRHNVERLAA